MAPSRLRLRRDPHRSMRLVVLRVRIRVDRPAARIPVGRRLRRRDAVDDAGVLRLGRHRLPAQGRRRVGNVRRGVGRLGLLRIELLRIDPVRMGVVVG